MIDDFEELKRKVEELKQRKARAEGAYQEHLKRIRKDHGVKTLAEAEQKLKKMKADEQRLAGEYLKAKKAFEKEWEGVL